MKGTSQVTWPKTGQQDSATPAASSRHGLEDSRLTLIDERVERKVRGYNPYDGSPVSRPSGDVWRRKPKRD